MSFYKKICAFTLCFGIVFLLEDFLPSSQQQPVSYPAAVSLQDNEKNSDKTANLITQILKEGKRQTKLKQIIEEIAHASYEIGAVNLALSILVDSLLKAKKPVRLNPEEINFAKKELKTGEYIFFNLEKFDFEALCGRNNRLPPNLIKKHFKIGLFIHYSEETGLAYVYYPDKKTTFRCEAKKVIPQQKIVIFEWE
jgi:hypothetical protein